MNAAEFAKGVIAEIKFRNGKGLFNPSLDLLTAAQFKFKPIIIGPFPNATTTINNTIWLSRKFHQWSLIDQQANFIHESVHLKQYKVGVFNFYDYFAHQETRYKLEIESEKLEILYRCWVGQINKNNQGEYSIQQANIWPAQKWVSSLKTTAEWYRIFRDICDESIKICEAQKYL